MAFSVSVSATESEVNIANNTSKLTVSLTLNSTYGSWFGDTKYGTIVIDGTSYGISYNFPSGTTSKNIGSASKVITHNNATGAYTANWSYSVPTNSSQGTKTGSGSTTLTTIARASEPSLSATSVNLNTAVTINTNRKNSSFTHTITYAIGNASGTIGTAKGVGASVSWTPPYSLADQFPNATSGNVTITCQTYNGNTLVGTKTCTLQVKTVDNTEFKPTIGLSASYTGKFNNNYLLNGISGITVSASTGFKHGATLSSYTISGASKSSTKAALSLSPINISMTSASTTLTFSGTITDSRGYTNTASNLTATVYRYNKPQIKSCNVYRCKSSSDSSASSNGTYAAVVITYTYQNDGYSNSMNTKSININGTPYPLTTTETTSNGVVTGTGTTIVGNGHLLITTSYPYTVTCKDAVNQSTTVTGSLPTAERIWDVRPQGKGLSVGKFAEHDNMVESAWNIKAPALTSSGTLSVSGNSTLSGTLSVSGNSTLSGTLNLSKEGVLAQGTRVRTINAGSGTSGYFNVCSFTINASYVNQPILLGITQRSRSGDLKIRFSSVNSKEPALSSFTKTGDINAYMHKASTSVWNLYIQKSEAYDQLEVTELHKGYYMNNVTIAWVNATVTSLPSGYVTARNSGIYAPTAPATETKGWYKSSMGAFDIYFRSGVTPKYTHSGGGWNWITDDTNNYRDMPGGMQFNAAKMIFVGNLRCDDAAIDYNVIINDGATQLSITWRNRYGSEVKATARYNFLLIVFP